MPNVHPLLVHLPIAILLVAYIFDQLSTILKKEELERVGWWTQLAGTVGLAATVVSGLLAEASIIIPEAAQEHLETHEQLAFVAAGTFATLFLWRISSKTKLPPRYRAVYLSLFAAGVLVIWMGAWFGGEMVYRYGVGVSLTP
jgi:uncharacterized membrane protein